ncbi:transmembrane protein 18 isoform X2 [Ranitomeya variabilis]|uniref:transmembrane protein 18 isoform X2 n=1 Tax=Ranitomeya variabilis TaxID=490064 RepID=UPI004055DD94
MYHGDGGRCVGAAGAEPHRLVRAVDRWAVEFPPTLLHTDLHFLQILQMSDSPLPVYGLYSRQQYFDSSGMFISLAFSAPLLCNTIIIVVHWVYKTLSVMTELKTLQNKKKAARDRKKEN